MAGPLLPLTKRQISSMNAIEALGILQDRPDEGDSEKRVQEQKAARTRLKQLEKTEAGRAEIKKARKDLELDVKANMNYGGMVKKKKTAKKMMGGGKVYSRGSRKASYNV